MKLRLAFALSLLSVMPAGAQTETVVSPSEFREYAEGYTLYFEEGGAPAGAESFGPEGQVTWQDPNGTCFEGLWRPYGDELCFYYGLGEDVQCWNVLRDDEGLKVRPADGEDTLEMTLRIVRRDRLPLLCGGPSFETRSPGEAPLSAPAPRPARW